VAEHSTDLAHSIQLQGTRILATRPATEIELHHDNMNRDKSFSLSKSWKPVLQTLKERRKATLSKEK
jgi:hypothetical protein